MDQDTCMKNNSKNPPEFSKIITVDESVIGKYFEIEASYEELSATAQRFGFYGIESLCIKYIIVPHNIIDDAYFLSAEIRSRVIRFAIKDNKEINDVNEKFEIVILNKTPSKVLLNSLENMDVEIISNGLLDIGEIAAQYLSLCIYM